MLDATVKQNHIASALYRWCTSKGEESRIQVAAVTARKRYMGRSPGCHQSCNSAARSRAIPQGIREMMQERIARRLELEMMQERIARLEQAVLVLYRSRQFQ